MKLSICATLFAVTALLSSPGNTRADYACPIADYSSFYGNYTYYAAVCHMDTVRYYTIVYSSVPLEMSTDCSCEDPIFVRTADDEAGADDASRLVATTTAPDGKPIHIIAYTPAGRSGARTTTVSTKPLKDDPTAPTLQERDTRFLRAKTKDGELLLKVAFVGQYAFDGKTLLSGEIPVAQQISENAADYSEQLRNAEPATIVSSHGRFHIVQCTVTGTQYILSTHEAPVEPVVASND